MGLRSAGAQRRILQSAIALVAVLVADAASAVTVSIPTNLTTGIGLPAVSVPVNIADSTGVLGVAVSFTYNNTVATATQVGAGTLTGACTIVPSITNNGTTGMVVITAACPSGLPSGQSGSLFLVTMQGVNNGVTALTFTQTPEVPGGCFLNEGSPSCESSNGQLTVGSGGPTATATATATNTTAPATATASATRTATATATNTVPTATASATPSQTFTNTAGPSPTPSQTRTATLTPTATPTTTVTNTPVNTNTPSPTLTASETPTQTQTRTVTPTRTITNTPPATTTRPAIPVVPSPASPAGVLMIVALGGGLVWALRRVSKSR